MVFVILLTGIRGAAAGTLDRTGTLWAPYLEWDLANPSWSGNPFDLLASVTFTHASSGEIRSTEMFYVRDGTWSFRFAATRTGDWTFVTSSADADLDGHTGSVTIEPNPDPDVRGFLTHRDGKFALQVGEDGELAAFRLDVYMNLGIFDSHVAAGDWTDSVRIDAYIDEAARHGFKTIFISVNNSWFSFGANRWDDHDSDDPDPRTFKVLETLLTRAHSQGVRVQIWAWGDEARRWTPVGVGGINGVPDKRLQRYIAARLGPVPGWTMGYGFDLQEWVNESQLAEWAEYLHRHFGWQHLVWARGRSNSELDAVSYSSHDVRTYNQIVKDLQSDPTRPHVYEERHTHERNDGLSMDGTRRFLWHNAMAGGMGCWWGFFDWSPHPYPSPGQLLTANEFWRERFLLALERDNSITDGLALKTPENARFVFYKEDTDSVQMDLSSTGSARRAVAVDTKAAYAEIDLGMLAAETQTVQLPGLSDWAVAVGTFGDPTPPSIPDSLSATAVSDSRVDLEWDAAEDAESGVKDYRIYRNDASLAVSPDTAFSDRDVTESTLYTYEVAARNGSGVEGPRSDAAEAITLADTTPPGIASVEAHGSPTRVRVTFSEAVEQTSAKAPANYAIDPGVAVTAAAFGADPQSVSLTTTSLSPGVQYTLTVNDVRDRGAAANAIPPDSRVTFEYHPRVTDGLLVLYDFESGGDTTVRDVSGVGEPLDLEVASASAVLGEEGALTIRSATILSSAGAATKIRQACQASNEITLEAWVEPVNTTQDGPARVVTLSSGPCDRNFTLGQHGDGYHIRLRTTATSDNGLPAAITPGGTVKTDLTHVVYTRAANGEVRVYIDGIERAANTLSGNLSNWNSTYRLSLANETSLDRAWRGSLHLVAAYARALSTEEIGYNFGAGPDPLVQLDRFRRGECNDDGAVDISDAVCGLDWLFFDGTTPGCVAALNANGDEAVDLSDAIWLLDSLFAGGPPPAEPFPDCGPQSLAADESLGCLTPPKTCQP